MLDPSQVEHVFALDGVPARPVFSFAVGLANVGLEPTTVTVRFEAILERPSGESTTLYQEDRSQPGWVEERIDLAPFNLDGARLVLRKTLIEGSEYRFRYSGWGDPVFVPSEPPRRASVILISIDTLRADRVGLYGYAPARTPVLDAFGRSGVWYEQVYSPSTWTVPSHASLLFGRHLAGMPVLPTPQAGSTPVAPDGSLRPLSEIFRAAGYLTAGFTGGGFLSNAYGFPRGFDTYFEFSAAPYPEHECPPERFDGPEVFQRATEWLRDRGRAPFFLFLHTYDVHDRCPFRKGTKGFGPWPALTPEENERLLGFYDDLIAGVDARIGNFLRQLDKLGLTDNTLVVITSDHGEFFQEHGLRGHGAAKPYEELVKVPLLIRYPGVLRKPARVTPAVSLVDVAPSILALVGLASDPGTQGRVLPGLNRAPARASSPIYVVWDHLLAVRQGTLKLIASRTGKFPDEVYDVENDRQEQHNLVSKPGPVAATLRQLADAFWKNQAPGQERTPQPEVDPQTRERLRALGYEQ